MNEKYSAGERLQILEEHFRKHIPVRQICLRYKISRALFYRWRRRYLASGKQIGSLKTRRRTEKDFSGENAKRVIYFIWEEPYLSLSELTQKVRATDWGQSFSRTQLYNLLVRFGFSGRDRRVIWAKAYRKSFEDAWRAIVKQREEERKASILTAQERLELINRVEEGASVYQVCTEAGISRTIFYRWKQRYDWTKRHAGSRIFGVRVGGAQDRELLDALEARRLARPAVYSRQATEEQVGAVIDVVYRHPEWGVDRVWANLPRVAGKRIIGRQGVRRILERADLNTAEKRRTWLASRPAVEVTAVRPELSWWNRLQTALGVFLTSLAAHAPPKMVFAWRRFSGFALFVATSSFVSFGLYSWGYLLGGSQDPPRVLGWTFASLALIMGSIFFLYSLKYYFTLAVVLSFSREGDSGSEELKRSEYSTSEVGTPFTDSAELTAEASEVSRASTPAQRASGPMGSDLSHPRGGGFRGWLGKMFSLKRSGYSTPGAPAVSSAESVKAVPTPGVSGSGGLEPDLGKVQLERRPFISVHIPLYNERRVAERLLTACTSFDYPHFEIVVADDSTDETTEIVRKFAERWNTEYSTSEVSADFTSEVSDSGYSTPGASAVSSAESVKEVPTPGVSIKVIHRADRTGFKGGALREALKHTDPRAEFIVVFDADFVPYPDTLELFLKYFQVNAGSLDANRYANNNTANASESPSTGSGQPIRSDSHDTNSDSHAFVDSRIAAVQGYQWHVLNKSENWITRGVRSEYAGSYVIERSGAELYGGMKQIAGSVYMIRRDLLDRFGWGTSLTEDFELTLRLYAAGYKVIYTPYIQAPAECASTLKRLVRQRMRWAEGHSFNIRKMFTRLLLGGWSEGSGGPEPIVHLPFSIGHVSSIDQFSNSTINGTWKMEHGKSSLEKRWIPSPLSLSEKLEFLYLSPYYLQAAFFLIGTVGWLLSETVFRIRIPFWTSVWGWSLVLTNLLSLPLMNAVGLFLEEAEERDYMGILSFTALTYLLAPFQAYASVKGFIERREGPWFRTPKTGRITDIFPRARFYRFIRGILPGLSAQAPIGADPVKSMRSHGASADSRRLALAGAGAQRAFSGFTIRKRQARWVGKLTLSLLLIITLSVYSLTKGVPEVLATNPSGTFYLRDEASSVLTGTGAEWRLADNQADTTDSTATIARVNNKKSAPLWFQYKPGATNSTEESGTSCAANAPDNAGWIFETAFGGGGQIASGTWTFYVNETDNRVDNVGTIQVCVWRVTVSGGVINTSNLLFGYNDSTDVWNGAVNNFSFTTGTVGPFSLGSNEYLYVEYFSNLATISSAGPSTDFDSIFRTGPTYSDPRFTTPSVTIPEKAIFLVGMAPFIPVVAWWLKSGREAHSVPLLQRRGVPFGGSL